MKGLRTVFLREIAAYFNSPIAYVFILVFLTMSSALFLFLPPFFAFPRAEITGLFGWLVPVLCVFVPAATMRIWAEERKENTLELLLTFPVRPVELVLGKYLAAMTFYLVALACTWTIPVMVARLGNPDFGPIMSGYFGALLLGGLFMALGIFISGLCRDQVIAFVLSFLTCVVVSLLGWDTFAMILDGTIGGLGTFLQDVVGSTARYLPFTRGVIELADVLYFVLWTGLLLFLNGIYLEGRSRPHIRALFSVAVVLCVLIGGLFTTVTVNTSLGRLDVTKDRIYTVSDATKRILSRLDVPVQVKLYITSSDKMPAEMRNLERDIMAKLREMQVASRNMVRPCAVHKDAEEVIAGAEREEKEAGAEKKSLEERLTERIKPFPVQTLREDRSTTQLVYSSLGIGYKNKDEEIIPQILPESVSDLEYRIVSTVYKLAREKAPVVAMVAPVDALNIPPYMMELYRQMGQMPPRTEDPYIYLEQLMQYEKYDVRRVSLTKEQPLPAQYDALVIVNPRALNARQKWEINRALIAGKPTFLAVQNYRWDYSVRRDRMSVIKRSEDPGTDEILAPSGLEVADDILMDANSLPLTVSDPSNPLESLTGGGIRLNLPMHITLSSTSMNPDASITSHLDELFYLWGSRLILNEGKLKENKIEVTTLFTSSPRAWVLPRDHQITDKDRDPPETTKKFPLAVLAKGQFVDCFKGKPRPGWPARRAPGMPEDAPGEEPDPTPLPPMTQARGKLILVGCAEMFSKNFLARGNLGFFINSIDALTLSDDLIQVRSSKPQDRSIARPDSRTMTFWKVTVLGFMSLVVVIAGFGRAVLLRAARDRYRAEMEDRT